MPITLRSVSSKRDYADFVAVPRMIYAGLPHFVAPLDDERQELINPAKASFFKHGRAVFFIAERDGKPIGRISAQIDDLADAMGRRDLGSFGCFDCIDDPDVSRALLDAAADWLRTEGRSVIEGPYIMSINGEVGLLVDGFDTPPATLVPWHPPYLQEHLPSAGFEQVKRMHSYILPIKSTDTEVALTRLKARRVDLDCEVRGLNLKNLQGEADIGLKLFNSAWKDNWGFVPLDKADMDGFIKGFGPILHEDCGVMLFVKGEPAAFAFVLPNVYDLFGDLGGKAGPLGYAKLLWRTFVSKPYKGVRIALFGVSENYRAFLGAQVALTMIKEIVARARHDKLEWLEAGWVLEDNRPVIALIEAGGFTRKRTHAVYRRQL